MKNIILFLLAFTTLNSYCQLFERTSFMSGKIITKYDTIKCFVAYQDTYVNMVKYKLDQNDKQIFKLEADEINHIECGLRKFDRITLKPNNSSLLKQHCIGKLSLYSNIVQVSHGTMVNSNGVPMIMGSYSKEEYYILKDSQVTKLKRGKFKDQLKEQMSDYPVIYPDIDKLKYNEFDLEFRLKDVITKYNNHIKYNIGS